MNRIDTKFSELKKKKQKALTTYWMAGDPDEKNSLRFLTALAESGADLIEVGFPFSDPMADGPVIQAAGERALKSGITLKKAFSLIQDFRKRHDLPIILMGYLNPLLNYGIEKFAQTAAKSGVDGVLIVDLPVEESDEIHKTLSKYNIHLIYLIAPTSTPERIRLIKKQARGFIYYVSVTGVTGRATLDFKKINSSIKNMKKIFSIPLQVGFGISSTQDAKQLSKIADGVIVGSALSKSMTKRKNTQQSVTTLKKFVHSLKRAIV